MAKLNATIKINTLGGAAARLAKQQAEESVTRTLVGLDKSKGDIKKVMCRAAKAIAIKLPSAFIDNEILDLATDVGAGYQLTIGSYNAYQAGKKFAKGYSEATDEEVAALKKELGIED